MECVWGVNRDEQHLCGTVNYILAFICDKCGNKDVSDMCGVHVDMWKIIRPTCKTCYGTLSFEIRNITTGETEYRINKASL